MASDGQSEKATLLESELGLSRAEVTLLSGDPLSYMQLVDSNADIVSIQKAFNDTCNFIATAADSGIPISVSVASGKFAASGSALAKALGASNVITYPYVRGD